MYSLSYVANDVHYRPTDVRLYNHIIISAVFLLLTYLDRWQEKYPDVFLDTNACYWFLVR
jgi:hypothetical protein